MREYEQVTIFRFCCIFGNRNLRWRLNEFICVRKFAVSKVSRGDPLRTGQGISALAETIVFSNFGFVDGVGNALNLQDYVIKKYKCFVYVMQVNSNRN